jgi:hypothetical protein
MNACADPDIDQLARRALARALRIALPEIESSDSHYICGDLAVYITEGAYQFDKGETGRRTELHAAAMLALMASDVSEILKYEPEDGP